MNLLHVNKDLQGKSFMIGTPAYGGQMSVPYVQSVMDLLRESMASGVNMISSFVENESLISRARNNIAGMFLYHPTKPDVLLFVDADIRFHAYDALCLVGMCSEERPLVAGAYAKKRIDWGKVVEAVSVNVPADQLERHIGNSVMNMRQGEEQHLDLAYPIEVLDTGTGFLAIHRSVFEEMIEYYKDEFHYTPDYHVHNPEFDNIAREKGLYTFFDTGIMSDETSVEKEKAGVRRYLSEDYWFMRKWRDLDKLNPKRKHRVLLCPWVNLIHHGTYRYISDFIASNKVRNAIVHQKKMMEQQQMPSQEEQAIIESLNETIIAQQQEAMKQ